MDEAVDGGQRHRLVGGFGPFGPGSPFSWATRRNLQSVA